MPELLATYHVRLLQESDYYAGYLDLLKEGFDIEPTEISLRDFIRFANDTNKHTFVVEKTNDSVPQTDTTIVASASILIEKKLIHNMGKVCHIEDVVVDSRYQGKGIGKKIVNYCINIATSYGCYKCILNCCEENEKFYAKCNPNFQRKGLEMALYL